MGYTRQWLRKNQEFQCDSKLFYRSRYEYYEYDTSVLHYLTLTNEGWIDTCYVKGVEALIICNRHQCTMSFDLEKSYISVKCSTKKAFEKHAHI